MNLRTIAEHTIDLDLLSGGICIDVGCRGFQFSEAMRDLGLKVVAYDLDEMEAPQGIIFMREAISDFAGWGRYKETTDLQAKHLSDIGTPITVVTLEHVYQTLETTWGHVSVDVLKLDCESAEYAILSDPNFQPIPKQISIEFHLHCHRALHEQYYDKCMENLLKYYVPVQHELTQAHGAGWNYWDSLFLRKDLIDNNE